MPRLSAEQIKELDKFAMFKNYELVMLAMANKLIPFDPNFRVSRMVRVKREEI